MTQPSVYTKHSGPRSGSGEKFSPRKERRAVGGGDQWRLVPLFWHQERSRTFAKLFNFSLGLPPLWIPLVVPPLLRAGAGRPQYQSHTRGSQARDLGRSLFLVHVYRQKWAMFAFTNCSSCSDQSQCPCRRTISFPKHNSYCSWTLLGGVPVMAQVRSCAGSAEDTVLQPLPLLQPSRSDSAPGNSSCSSSPSFPIQLWGTRTFVTVFSMLTSLYYIEYNFQMYWESISYMSCSKIH